MDYFLKCTNCNAEFDKKFNKQICNKCGSILDVKYNKLRLKKNNNNDFWAYEEVLPNAKYKHYAIGGTKIIKSNENENLFLKLELENPTKSFKDRGSVVEIAKCIEYGYDEIACASTGNMGFSVAYFAKLNNIKAKIFVSANANKDKIKDIKQVHDADIIKVNGDFNLAQKFAEKYSQKNNVFLGGDYCYRKEGQKIVVYEIINQLNPSNILVPIGNATLLYGVLQAIDEMKSMNFIKNSPKVIGVQAKLCSPFIKAFNTNANIKYEKPKTSADAIAVGYPTFGTIAIEKLKKNNGIAISVSEKEMKLEQKLFYKNYGLISETAGVATVAAFKKLKLNGKTVAIISGGNI